MGARLIWYSNLSKSWRENRTSLISQENSFQRLAVTMLRLIIFFLPLVACHIQGNLEMMSYQGENIPIRIVRPTGFEGAPQTPANQCDGYSCNGLEYKLVNPQKYDFDGEDVTFGMCQTPHQGEDYCFVNEDSACAKQKSEAFPGKYVSTEPCKAHNAPKKRFIFELFAHGAASGCSIS